MNTSILNPTQEIEIRGEKITVKELNWREARAFLQVLGASVGQFITSTGRPNFTEQDIPEMITRSTALTDMLATKATGKDQAWLDELTAKEVMAVLEVAIELNLSAELFARGKAVAGRVKAVFAPPSIGAAQMNSTATR